MGDGGLTRFWEESWVGGEILRVTFPRLFQLSNDKSGLIKDMGSWVGERWVWSWNWRRELFERENVMVLLLSLA